ncbi:MAG: DUF1127 domain-containing protein [Candidatus Eiseniibacteriota bacterium]
MAHWTLTLERKHLGHAGAGLLRRLSAAAVRATDTVYLWLERARDRDKLAGLDAHILKDIGIGRSEIEREISKPFWRE